MIGRGVCSANIAVNYDVTLSVRENCTIFSLFSFLSSVFRCSAVIGQGLQRGRREEERREKELKSESSHRAKKERERELCVRGKEDKLEEEEGE